MSENKIELRGIKCYAYHGCLKEESIIGQEYIVNIEIHTDFSKAFTTDSLQDTIDYCEVYELVKTEMANKQKLIEAVGQKICNRLRNRWNSIDYCVVEIVKPRPPIGGEVDDVRISVTA